VFVEMHAGAGGVLQTVPQAPQLWASLALLISHPLASWPSQSRHPVSHVPTVQRLMAQPRDPCGTLTHTLSQLPQWSGSVAVFAQEVPQATSGSVQLAAHWLFVHTRPPAQGIPQPPQFLTSVLVLISQPLAALASQSLYPGSHWPMPHLDPAQPRVPFKIGGHLRSQPLQLSASDLVSTHEAPQVTSGAWQVAAHWPFAHTWPFGQGLAQPPQF
jgi:hypothetical protein